MALAEIANEDLKVNFLNTAPGSPTLVPPVSDPGIDTVKIVPVKSISDQINTKYICVTSITMTFAVGPTACPFTSTLCTFVAGAGTIMATAVEVDADSQAVLRKDDLGACAGTWTNNSTGATVPCACTVKISNAGQTDVEGS